MICIYAITNIVNDKQYVGQAVVKYKRWKNHRIALRCNKHENKHLQSAYNKYGEAAFIYTVLEIISDVSLLDEREQYWMDKLDCVDPKGYNLQPIAGSSRGYKHSIETKMKWSEQRKGKKRSAQFALSVSIRMTGKIITEDTRQKLVDSHTGHKHSDETKAKMSAARKGNQNAADVKQTKEQIEHRTSFIRGRKETQETKDKKSKAMKGRTLTPEHRAKLSKAAKNRRKPS